MRTYTPTPRDLTRSWLLIDAEDKVLGRLATEIAGLLRGKHKPQFSYHIDCGDHVVVVNAAKLVVTSGKELREVRYRHSGYPGGLKSRSLADEIARHPEEVLRRAVKGMLPRNRLGRAMLKKLKIYAGPEHPHEAQFKGTPGEPNSRRAERDAKKAEAKAAAAKTRKPAAKKAAKKPAAKPETEPETAEAAAEAPESDAVPAAEAAAETPESDAVPEAEAPAAEAPDAEVATAGAVPDAEAADVPAGEDDQDAAEKAED